jgi:hypothetical protein
MTRALLVRLALASLCLTATTLTFEDAKPLRSNLLVAHFALDLMVLALAGRREPPAAA